MCRYAFTSYKPHFACFECQKTFKRKLLKDIQGGISKKDDEVPAKCPECSELMANMGLDFKSPKTSDNKAWSHLKTLYKVGITFHSCGCSGPGYIPRDRKELIARFEETKNEYLKHQHFWAQRRKTPNTQSEIDKDKHKNWEYLYRIPKEMRLGNNEYNTLKAQIYWNEKAQVIEDKIRYLTHANNMHN